MENNKDFQLIRKLNKDWSKEDIEIEKAGGQTNRNWIVSYKEKKYFVRLPWERTDIVNRKAEGKNILAISKNKKLKGIVPKFFLYVFEKRNILNPKEELGFPDGTMVMEYIEGKDIDGEDLKQAKVQTALLKSLYGFHSSKLRFVNKYDAFKDEVEKYRKKAREYPLKEIINEKELKEIEDIGKSAKEKLDIKGEVSTHNDLIFENLRLGKDGKVYLLDFEYGGLNIREGLYYDLGIILGGNLFQKIPMEFKTFGEILEKAKAVYKKDLDEGKIYWSALTNILVMFWWGMVKYFSSGSEEKEYFRNYILRRGKKIKEIFKMIN